MNNKISIIVPAYNVEQWIARCIDSILAQTYCNLEIIIIDDGSTDRTLEIIEEYAKKDNRIKPIHQKNCGLVEVREKGIKLASGEYIGFIDGDDEIEPDMYERLLQNAIENDAPVSQCGILYCFYDGRKKPMHGTGEFHVFDQINGYRELMQGTRMEPSLCNKLYKKELLEDSCLDKTIINNEDLLRNSVVFTRAEKSVFEDFCGYHYWRREESMSNNKNSLQMSKHILKARKTILEMAEPELQLYAFHNYINAVFSTYNILIGNQQNDTLQFKNQCKDTLEKYSKEISSLGIKMNIKRRAIKYVPFIYDFLYKIHNQRVYKRIEREKNNSLLRRG